MALELAKHVQKEGLVIEVKEKENPTEPKENEASPCDATVRPGATCVNLHVLTWRKNWRIIFAANSKTIKIFFVISAI